MKISTTTVSHLVAFLSGLIFSIGLSVSQMVNPDKVLSFLDIFGHWDPSLLLVMGSALVIYWLGYILLKPNFSAPVADTQYHLPASTLVDKPLLFGALLFGLGWGLTGLCPGPMVANIAGGEIKIIGFLAVMLVSMKVFDAWSSQ